MTSQDELHRTGAWTSADNLPTEFVKLRRPSRWITAAVLAVLAVMMAHGLVTNYRFGWDVVGDYFTSKQILVGLQRTLVLTVLSMLVGIIFGTWLAVIRLSGNRILGGACSLYIWFFRGTPLLVQLIFWYNLAALYPRIGVGVPFGPMFVTGETNTLITVYVAAVLGLGLNEAAYMAEVIRSGLISVDRHQTEAAEALGMPAGLLFRRIVLPQALRVIVPPTANQAIGMLKATSLVSVLALPELLYSAQLIYAKNYQTIPLLVVASIWYLLVTTVLSIGQRYLERYYGKGSGTRKTPTAARRYGRRPPTPTPELALDSVELR